MYNEVEKMILDSFIQCPFCGVQGKDIKRGGICTTIAATKQGERGAEEQFNNKWLTIHDHDTNRMDAQCECVNGHKFVIVPLNSCWCGWRQG